MGMRGPWAHPLPGFRAAPKPPSKHRFRCRECRRSFTCVRDDRRFCSGACRIRNFRRRGAVSAGKTEKIVHAETARGSDRLQTHIKDMI